MSRAPVQTGNLASYNLPELPEVEAAEMFERIQDYERSLASPSLSIQGYNRGTAAVDNDDALFVGTEPAILLTEHATDHWRQRRGDAAPWKKSAEWGLAGLGGVLSQDVNITFLTPTGRQTGDANHDSSHPLKEVTGRLIEYSSPLLFTTVHGMANGAIESVEDTKPFDVMLGTGENPTPETQQMVEVMKKVAEGLDLRTGENQWFLRVKGSTKRKEGTFAFDDDGVTHKRQRFSAKGVNTTRATAERIAEEHNIKMAAVQIELSRFLRLLPKEFKRDHKERVMGVYLGYLLMRDSLQGYLQQYDTVAEV